MQVCKDALERARPRTDQKREAPAEMDKVVTFESDHVTTYSVKMGSQRFSMVAKHDDQGLCSSVVIGSAVSNACKGVAWGSRRWWRAVVEVAVSTLGNCLICLRKLGCRRLLS